MLYQNHLSSLTVSSSHNSSLFIRVCLQYLVDPKSGHQNDWSYHFTYQYFYLSLVHISDFTLTHQFISCLRYCLDLQSLRNDQVLFHFNQDPNCYLHLCLESYHVRFYLDHHQTQKIISQNLLYENYHFELLHFEHMDR